MDEKNIILTAKNICKNYGHLEILKNVSLEINKGEVVSIVGPSGAGKSTLLHILGSLDKSDSGEVLINNINLSSLKSNKLADFRATHIGFVFQFHHLLPEFTAIENVCIPGYIAKNNKKEVYKRALELFELLNLSHRIEHKPGELSGGEQQRVAIARALINNPDIILADEPSGNLDTLHAAELHELIFTLRKNFNQSFLIVTHNEILSQRSDRILKMKDGTLT